MTRHRDACTNGYHTRANPFPAFSSSTTTANITRSKFQYRQHCTFSPNHSPHTVYICSNSLWKHAITTSENNTEIKVWSCATWECLQTIVFKSNTDSELYFKAEIDPTSSYLVLTDTTSRGLYVLQVAQNIAEILKSENGSKSDNEQSSCSSSEVAETKSHAFIKSIAEFALSSPILSFGIIDATVRKYKCAYNDIYLLEELDDYDEDSLNRYCVVIHLYLVQPKSVQECHILYQPTVSVNTECGSSISANSDGTERSETLLDSLATYVAPTSAPVIETTTSTVQPDTQQLLEAIMNKSPCPTKTDGKLSAQSITNSKPASLSLMTPDSFHSHSEYLFLCFSTHKDNHHLPSLPSPFPMHGFVRNNFAD